MWEVCGEKGGGGMGEAKGRQHYDKGEKGVEEKEAMRVLKYFSWGRVFMCVCECECFDVKGRRMMKIINFGFWLLFLENLALAARQRIYNHKKLLQKRIYEKRRFSACLFLSSGWEAPKILNLKLFSSFSLITMRHNYLLFHSIAPSSSVILTIIPRFNY